MKKILLPIIAFVIVSCNVNTSKDYISDEHFIDRTHYYFDLWMPDTDAAVKLYIRPHLTDL